MNRSKYRVLIDSSLWLRCDQCPGADFAKNEVISLMLVKLSILFRQQNFAPFQNALGI